MLTVIPPFGLLALSVLTAFLTGCLRNVFSKGNGRTQNDVYAFSSLTMVCSLLWLLPMADSFSVSVFTVGLGVVFGLLTLSCTVFCMRALQCGPMSLTTILGTASMLIPTFSGALFWQERVSLIQWGGVALMLVMLVLTVARDREESTRSVSLRWVIYCGISCLSSGMIGILQKLHQSSPYREELDGFLMIALCSSAVCGALPLLAAHRKGERLTCSLSPRRGTFWLAVLSSAGVALPNKINLYLSGVMDSAVFFPLVNGGGLILALLAAILLFHERPTRRQVVGLFAGLLAVFLLGIG